MTQIKLAVILLVAVILSVGVTLFTGHYRELTRAAEQNEQRAGVLANASAGIEDGVDIDAFLSSNQVVIGTGRNNFQRAKQEAIRNEPETADRADRAVPDSVRRAYRERRIARERRGCAGGQCQQDNQARPAAQR